MTQVPDHRFDSVPPPKSGGLSALLYDPKFRSYASQIIVVLLLIWGLVEIVGNTQANLKKLNQNFGFDFLTQASGFDVITSLISYSSTSSYARALLVGFWNTILVSVLGIMIATALGFVLGIMRLSKNWLVSRVAGVYVEVMRNTPLLLQIFMWYALVLKPLPGPKQAINYADSIFISNRGINLPYPIFGSGAWVAPALLIAALIGTWMFRRWSRARQAATGQILPIWSISSATIVLLPIFGFFFAGWPVTWDYPSFGGFNFKGGFTLVPEFMALLIALSTFTAAFIAEVVRSGIQAVSKGQSEAAGSLGLKTPQALRLVVIPQAMRVIVPPLTSQFLNLTKNSSLATAIGYPDFVATGGTVMNQSGKAIEIVFIWMVVYLSLSLATSAFMNWYNARMKLVER